jgi:hypothetical protein
LILEALTFRSNHAAHRPVIDALTWLKTHRDSRQQFVACRDIPIDGVVRPQFQELLNAWCELAKSLKLYFPVTEDIMRRVVDHSA